MALISLQEVSLSFGGLPLFDGADLSIEEGERVCLLGRNGTGKSTLLKLVEGDIPLDGGQIVRRKNLKVASLAQEVPSDLSGAVYDVVAGGLTEDESAGEGHGRVEMVLSMAGLDGSALFENLSAGMKRRVLLARGLVLEPHILLLDEPTNHLDIEAIAWLEDFLLRANVTLLFVTHDRLFLQKLATRIVELDRGRLINWNCDYRTYLERRDNLLAAEESQNARFDKKLAAEEVWIRQGVKARRTRNEGRVRALMKLRDERRARREQAGNANLRLQEARLSGKLVVETEGVDCGYGSRTVVKNLSTVIMRGDKIGIIGPNGAGKTTLLKTLLGKLPPVAGRVKLGTSLDVAYFDQMRGQLDDGKTVRENVAEGNDYVVVDGRQRHVMGYLQDFLFTPDRAMSPVKVLSGGERNRLLMAKLFAKPANLIVMDEPTNDLDLETLDLLEEILSEYSGTLLLVSHDRAFINNVVTSTLVFEGEGRVGEYVGGYDDWLLQSGIGGRARETKREKTSERQTPKARPRKLSFKEARELEELPGRIESLEARKEEICREMSSPAFYREALDQAGALNVELERIETNLAAAFERWDALERIKTEGEKAG